MQDIFLVGAGHAHVLLLRRLVNQPIAGARFTLITPEPVLYYSGALPRLISGELAEHDISVNVARLAVAAGVRLIVGSVTQIDAGNKWIGVGDRPPLSFDVLSLDVGGCFELNSPAVFHRERAMKGLTSDPYDGPEIVPVKPTATFVRGWERIRNRLDLQKKRIDLVVVGGGVASVEMALAVREYQRQQRPNTLLHIYLVSRQSEVAVELPRLAREILRLELMKAEVHWYASCEVVRVTHSGLVVRSGGHIHADLVLWSTRVQGHTWLIYSDLRVTPEGFVVVNPSLTSVSHPHVFAVGDVAHFLQRPLPKTGVYAVRQTAVLYDNLVATVQDKSRRNFYPQRDFLKILNIGRGRGLVIRAPLVLRGAWALRWKNRIDQRFLRYLTCDVEMALCTRKNSDVERLLLQERVLLEKSARLPEMSVTNVALFNTQTPIWTGQATPLVWGDVYRLGRHVALACLGRVLDYCFQPESLKLCVNIPPCSAVCKERDFEVFCRGFKRVFNDIRFNPWQLPCAEVQARSGDIFSAQAWISGNYNPVPGWTDGRLLLKQHAVASWEVSYGTSALSDGDEMALSAIITHPLGSGYWQQAVLSGALAAEAWKAMTDEGFEKAHAWWQLIDELQHQGFLLGVRLIEHDGVLPVIHEMVSGPEWVLRLDLLQIRLLPDLVDQFASDQKTVFLAYPELQKNWEWVCEHYTQELTSTAVDDAPLPVQALCDANMGLAWVCLVRLIDVPQVLSRLADVGLNQAFCAGHVFRQSVSDTPEDGPIKPSLHWGRLMYS